MTDLSASLVFDPVRSWARLAPHRAAVVDRATGGRVSYAELDREAERWAELLHGRGVRPGDRVAVLAGNRSEQVALLFACVRVGAALVPLNWRLPAAELAPVLADARPVLLLVERRLRDIADRALAASGGNLPTLDLDEDRPRDPGEGRDTLPAHVPRAEDALLVLYTSGSTGRPKGAVIPHRQVVANALATSLAWELGPADVGPVSTPFFHTGGWNVFATPLWMRGGTVVLFEGFDADGFLRGIAEERCTVAMTVPTQLLMLTESPRWGEPLPDLRFFISGGAPCPPALATAVRASGYGFREGYGLTECGPNCFAISEAEAGERPGSVGRPVPFLEARLVDAEGEEVPDGEAGELWLRGPQRFSGYLGDPLRTAEALTADGWLRTGDLAVRDTGGTFRICGRRREMFISGGENVFPGEVESALADCPGVAESVVLGVPDPRWGEVGCAFVVPRPDAALDDASLLAQARLRLAGYKVPKRVVFLRGIPRLGSGKPDRAALQTLIPHEAS
jgi:fatty-acyl-CoA synthase